MTGIKIRGSQLRALRHQKRLSGAGLGERVERTETQVYRIESGSSQTSLEFLDRCVEVFGLDAVADLIVTDEQRNIFLGGHQVPA